MTEMQLTHHENDRAPEPTTDVASLERAHGIGWLAVLLVTVAVAVAVTDRTELTGTPTLDLLLHIGFVAVLVGGSALVFLRPILPPGRWPIVAAVLALLAWTPLMLTDDRWALTTFGIYALCYTLGTRLGILCAGYVSGVWAAALLLYDSPAWAIMMPAGVFVVSSILALTIERISELNVRQTELISELRATQRELVASEREKGVLAERARLAAEIHDTLAQGFTSIVLLSRAGLRAGSDDGGRSALTSIETTAQENLADARRMIEAVRPPELTGGSLSSAVERQLDATLPDGVERSFAVVGEPRPLTGAVEVTVLRAAQEALLNVRNHAAARRVDVTLTYLDDAITLDVRDDGVGLGSGEVRDRGTLTGGQGLTLLQQRAASLAGRLRLESPDGGGSLVSLMLPAGAS